MAVPKTPLERFRAAAQKVIAMHRTTAVLTSRGAGAEPGVDPRRLSADLRYRATVREACEIRVLDYSGVSLKSKKLTNQGLVDMLIDPAASQKPSWAKVRWIDVGGISWDVLKAIAIRYNVHPLALEDVLHTHSKASTTKSNYYLQHLFLRVLCLELRDENSIIQLSDAQREGLLDVDSLQPDVNDGRHRGHTSFDKNSVQVEVLKQSDRVNVNVFPVFIFLFKDGTVITMHKTTNPKLTEPIVNRLSRPDTLLRSSSDASFLVESLLDLAVDKAIGVAEECESKLKKFERQLLLRLSMNTVSNLHILTGDISLHQRALEPLKRMIYGLRRYDLDRCIALLDHQPGEEPADVQGYMSHTSQIYLADVYNHIEYILGSFDIIYNLSENLIGYSFNMTSYEMNAVMRRLTLITVICLPLTFLTGYGGMNFEAMWWTVNPEHSDVWFWIVTLPVMAIVMPLFLVPDLKRLYQNMQKRKTSHKALQSFQSQRAGSSYTSRRNRKSTR